MLEQARARGLYQRLSLCTLGQEPLPSPEGTSSCTLTPQGPLDRAPFSCQVSIPLAEPSNEPPSMLSLHSPLSLSVPH